MSRTEGTFDFPSNFECKTTGPIDARTTTPSFSHLTDSSIPFKYLGMLVAVTNNSSDTSKNGLYLLSANNGTSESDWTKVGADVAVMGADDVYDAGLVPAGASDGTGFLKQDGSWATPTNTDTQANWNETTTTSAAYIQNKPTGDAVDYDVTSSITDDDTTHLATAEAIYEHTATVGSATYTAVFSTLGNSDQNSLGTAAYLDSTTSITQSSDDLITSGAVYSELANYLETDESAVGVSTSSNADIESSDNSVRILTDSTVRMDVTNAGHVKVKCPMTCGSTSEQTTDAIRANGRVSLNVMGGTSAQGEIQIGRFADDDNSSLGQHRYHTIKAQNDGTNSNNFLEFNVHQGGNAENYRATAMCMKMLGNGRVGVGKSPTSERLEVDGNVLADDFKFTYGSSTVSVSDVYETLGDYALSSDLPSTTTSVTNSSTALVTSGGVYTALSAYARTVDVPTNNNQLLNGAGYAVSASPILGQTVITSDSKPQLKITPVVSAGQDARIDIIGKRNGSTGGMSQVYFKNYDDDKTGVNTQIHGAIFGRCINATSNLGELQLHTSANGAATNLCLSLHNNNSATFESSLRVKAGLQVDGNVDAENNLLVKGDLTINGDLTISGLSSVSGLVIQEEDLEIKNTPFILTSAQNINANEVTYNWDDDNFSAGTTTTYTNGITHTNGQATFTVNKTGMYLITFIVRSTAGSSSNRAMFFMELLRRTSSGSIKNTYYVSGSNYYRDANDNYDDVALSGTVTMMFRGTETFELKSVRMFSQGSGNINANTSLSELHIERFVTSCVGNGDYNGD